MQELLGHYGRHTYAIMNITPSEDIPNGYKHIVGDDIFVSAGNYTVMRSFSAKAVIIAVGFLKEVEKAEK